MSSHFDVVVLGAGPGGYVAAIRAAQLGKKTAIIEKEYWGGVCLNVGCIPTKSLLRNAELANIVTKQASTFGISGDVTVDFGKAYSRSRDVSGRMVNGIHYLMKKNKITEYHGWGEFTGPKNIVVKDDGGAVSEELTFDNCIIASGSSVKTLPGTQLSERVVTYREQILSDEVPESIIIAGSGAIGTEFAYVLANYGAKVTIVEFLDRMVPNEDPEVSKELTRAYKKMGVKVMAATKVDAIDDSGDKSRSPSPRPRAAMHGCWRPTGCCRPSDSPHAPRDSGWRPPGSSSPSAAPSPWTTSCAPMSTASMPSVTARQSSCWPTLPRPRASSPPRPSQVPRPCRSTTT